VNYGIFFANVGPFADPEPFGHLVTAAERVGFESVWTVEHVVIPVGYHATYPYHPSGKIPIPNDTSIPDPLLPLAFAAAITKTIKLGTGIVILPQRHPLYMAKEAATLDRLSNGRLLLGIGIGWLKEEFDALGIPFGERASRTDETVRAMRSLWKGEPEAFESEFFRWGPVDSWPKPVHNSGVPIVVGGHSKAAAKRAARLGDGFFPGVFSPEELADIVGVMNEECARIGRDPKEIEVTAVLASQDRALAERMAEAGAARLLTGYAMTDVGGPQQVEDWLGGFADAMIR
jgi:probable F420-dependent oxidoreductase